MATDIATITLPPQGLPVEDAKSESVVDIQPQPSPNQLPGLGSITSVDLSLFQKACAILDIIYRYRLDKPGSPSPEGSFKFLAQLYDQVRVNQPVRMCLPAFPFKSPNKQNKVLGRLPDKAEEFALAHINGLCAAIQDVYSPGAELTIISDGLVYNGRFTLLD